MQSLDSLADFKNKVMTSIRPIEVGEGREEGANNMDGADRDSTPMEIETDTVVALIEELSNFRVSHLRNDRAYEAAEQFLQGQPEDLLNRTVTHVKYLFGVASLEGLLPRMNQVYLSTEESKNFLNEVRGLLHIEREGSGGTDGAVYSEIMKRL